MDRPKGFPAFGDESPSALAARMNAAGDVLETAAGVATASVANRRHSLGELAEQRHVRLSYARREGEPQNWNGDFGSGGAHFWACSPGKIGLGKAVGVGS